MSTDAGRALLVAIAEDRPAGAGYHDRIGVERIEAEAAQRAIDELLTRVRVKVQELALPNDCEASEICVHDPVTRAAVLAVLDEEAARNR